VDFPKKIHPVGTWYGLGLANEVDVKFHGRRDGFAIEHCGTEVELAGCIEHVCVELRVG